MQRSYSVIAPSEKYSLETTFERGQRHSDNDDVTESDKLFHVRVAAIGKARSPTVNRGVDGTTRAQVDAAVHRGRRHAGDHLQGTVMPNLEDTGRLVLDLLLHFQPMQLLKEWRHMSSSVTKTQDCRRRMRLSRRPASVAFP